MPTAAYSDDAGKTIRWPGSRPPARYLHLRYVDEHGENKILGVNAGEVIELVIADEKNQEQGLAFIDSSVLRSAFIHGINFTPTEDDASTVVSLIVT